MKLGKLPHRPDHRDLPYEAYAESLVLTPPASDTDNVNRFSDWGLLGNDQYGDCVFAGAGHETMLWEALSGHKIGFSAQETLSDYSAVTGFNPNDPNSDQGTDVRTALKYRRTTGVADATGKRHKLSAYLALEPGNHTHVREAVHLFDGVGIGFQFPSSAMAQFNSGHPWTVVSGATIEGGHYVPVIGYTARTIYVVTWGKVQRMSWGFFSRYADEAWALLSQEFLTAGKSPEGFNLTQLQADLASL